MGLGWIDSIGRKFGKDSGASGEGGGTALTLDRPGGKRADSPLPSALRCLSTPVFIVKNLLRQSHIALGTPRSRIIGENGLPVARGFRKADTARYHCGEHLVL